MTGQNTSSAVMAQRKGGKPKKGAKPEDMERDDFPTPPWATRALIEHVILPHVSKHCFTLRPADVLKRQSFWEPACGRGFMSEALKEYFPSGWSSDIDDYGYPGTRDIGSPFQSTKWIDGADWIITNPPFNQAAAFIHTALAYARVGVAVFARSNITEGCERFRELWSLRPPTIEAKFVERVPIVKGRVDRTARSATAYSWLVWTSAPPQPPAWIPQCRKQLEREEDYIEPRLRRKRA